jgi:colanic acid/amylovoran biosynthesis glycosyltransferase
MKVVHLWQDYSPNLFDRSHPLCLQNSVSSEVVCQNFIDNGAGQLPNTFAVRYRTPEETNSTHLYYRITRLIRREYDARRFANLVHKRLSAETVDFVHIHFGTTAAILADLNALPKCPFVVSFYGVDISQVLFQKSSVRAYKRVIEKADLLHVLCNEAKLRLLNLGCPPHKIHVQNLPINLLSIPNIGNNPAGQTRFLIPARFVEKKGHLILFDAFRRLVDSEFPVTLTCFGYGPSDWLLNALSELNLSDFVTVINNHQSSDFMSEYLHYLRVHDIVLAPSIRASNGDDEGGPALSIVMAQAAGKPVITSDFPGAERSVTDGREGLVVPSGDSDSLYEAMASLVGAESAWRIFGEAGRQRVRRDFSDDTYWKALQTWYLS